VPHWLSVP